MIYNDKFSKVNSPRKERSEAWSQEEAHLKISEIEGNIKANLVRVMFWLLTLQILNYCHILALILVWSS